MSEDPKSIVLEACQEVLQKMGVVGEVTISEKEGKSEPTLLVHIQTEESRLLIGERGANLAALQHLLRVLVNHKAGEHISFVVDINDYRAEKEDVLEQLAKRAVEKVQSTSQLVILKPMSAYERRMVHTYVSDVAEDLATESLGEEPNRRVVIKPKGERKSLDQMSDDIDL